MFEYEIRQYLEETHALLDSLDVGQLNSLISKLEETRKAGHFIYIMGNGGSASTASHFVNDFNKGVSEGLLKRYRFLCLNDNTSTVMAVANDIGYDEIFRFQLENYLEKGDLVIGISGSGNSLNVIKAFEFAQNKGAFTVGIVGFSGGKLIELSNLCVHVKSESMQHVEDAHMLIAHLMMSILKAQKGGTC